MSPLVKLWEFEIPDDVEHCYIHDGHLYFMTSRLLATNNYRYSVGSYLIETGTFCWSKTITLAQSSWHSQCTVFDGRLLCVIGCTVLQFDCSTGDDLCRFRYGDVTDFPVIVHDGKIIASSASGQITVYDLRDNCRTQPIKVASSFHYAVVRDNTLYALTWRKVYRRFLLGRRKAPQIEKIALDDFTGEVFVDLSGSTTIDGISGTDIGLLVAEGSTISLVTPDSQRKWSHSLGPKRDHAMVGFHGTYGGRLLISAYGWLSLIDSSTGESYWEHELDDISDALLLEDGSVIFSTCGGGWSMLPFADPGNCVGRLVPNGPSINVVYRMPWTANVHLRRFNDMVVASSEIREPLAHRSRCVGFGV